MRCLHNRGFSLIGILAFSVVFSIGLMSAQRLFSYHHRAQLGMGHQASMEDLKLQVQNTLNIKGACDAIFGGTTFQLSPEIESTKVAITEIHFPSTPNRVIAAAGVRISPRLAISEVYLSDFLLVMPSQYSANLYLRAEQEGALTQMQITRKVPLALEVADLGGGVLEVQKCLNTGESTSNATPSPSPVAPPSPAPSNIPQYDFICEAVLNLRPAGQGTDIQTPLGTTFVKHKCPKVEQVITACTAILYPNGLRVCGTTPMTGRDPADGKAYCTTFDCDRGTNSTDQWGINYQCCEINKNY